MRTKQTAGGLGVGGSSILVIFVLLSLTTFATLALMSAQSSYRLAERVAAASEAYFAADARAEEILAQISAAIHEARGLDNQSAEEYLKARLPDIEGGVYFSPAGQERGVASYEVPIDSARWLRVELEADFDRPGLRVLTWMVMAEPFQIDHAATAPPIWH